MALPRAEAMTTTCCSRRARSLFVLGVGALAALFWHDAVRRKRSRRGRNSVTE